MKCGICQQPLSSLKALCTCGDDPYAGLELAEGRYRLLGSVAKGGMGIVYRTLRLEDNALCAIKISRWNEALQQLRQFEPEEARKEEKARVSREFELLKKASSQTPHIMQVFDQVHDDPRIGLYYPMEFLEGSPLSNLPIWGYPLPKKQVVQLVLQMCEGIGIAHGLGVVHRDLNPDNMFIVRHEEHEQFVKLIDFGIARDLYARRGAFSTGHDMAFGHLHYLAPEQVGYSPKTGKYERETASKLDTRADLYTIGAIMFHMLTGYPPFEDDTLEGLAHRTWGQPANLERAQREGKLPRGLREIVLSCLKADPNQRPPDIYVLTDMLRSYQENPLGPPPPPSARSKDPFGGTSSDIWSALDEGLSPQGINALDEFSIEFDSMFEEQDIAEVTIESSQDALNNALPADVLASLENAPAFLEELDVVDDDSSWVQSPQSNVIDSLIEEALQTGKRPIPDTSLPTQKAATTTSKWPVWFALIGLIFVCVGVLFFFVQK